MGSKGVALLGSQQIYFTVAGVIITNGCGKAMV